MSRCPVYKVALVALVLAFGCTLGSGNDTPISIGVNWFPQARPYYCVPASIQMWALYDNMPVSQDAIANALGFVPNVGVPALNVAPGVNRFTATRDAFLVSAFFGGPDYYSKQITSINNLRPFLGVFDSQHVVTVEGGNWHIDDNTGLYVWEEVLFHDPQARNPGSTMSAGDWLTFNTDSVISASASYGSTAYLNQYGGNVVVRGSDGGFNPPPV